MSSTIAVDVVRVFTNEAGEHGNELGIVRSDASTSGREQAIAAELGFSETVFVDELGRRLSPDDGGSERTAVIRIFTPVAELPFAGHPSVGTAWWLAHEGSPVDVLLERAGDVRVRYDADRTWITGRASWAPHFEWMPLADPAQVDALDPAAVTAGHHYAYAWIDEEAGALRSRMFAPELGIAEDEATGAAAVRITTVLGRDLEILQGRGSRLSTRLGAGESVEVGGRTVADQRIEL
ncbi:PhzF family phenazine biosynthesis protein [Compostimonas suwonensis]|uniref:PhzF family phenazine biosynthesis protein n=1 Tax=Compostimonas suwonensis TaxID=1048394 RepID=A0A2M9BB30_9MICO|nr:PhzF family phenazine biosynthesis protein [Compostimonas suwonensis]PJJ55137.1 PhzF family phenazine biosynthesis protein [Compostimonas suwonensis]